MLHTFFIKLSIKLTPKVKLLLALASWGTSGCQLGCLIVCLDLSQILEALTSSWSNGVAGPICFCLAEGSAPAAKVREWNCQHVGEAMIIFSGTNSHFMSASSLLEVLDQCYSVALEKQRQRILGLCYLQVSFEQSTNIDTVVLMFVN